MFVPDQHLQTSSAPKLSPYDAQYIPLPTPIAQATTFRLFSSERKIIRRQRHHLQHENRAKGWKYTIKRMMTIQTKFTLLFGIITSFCGFWRNSFVAVSFAGAFLWL